MVVLTKDGGDHLERGLAALFAARPTRGGAEVLLVDNASSDGAPERATRRFPGLRLLRSERNLGFAGGVMLGASSSSSELLVLVNDDAVVEEDALASLVEALDEAGSDVIAAAGVLTDPGGDRVDFVDGLVTFDGHALQRWVGQRLAEIALPPRGEPRLFPCGGLCAVRRRPFEALGGFDTDFFAYLEDVDFGWRAALAGFGTVFVPEARARHLSGATGQRLGLAMRGVLFEANALAVVVKNLGDDALAALLPAILFTREHRTMWGLLERQEGAREALGDAFSPLRLPVRLASELQASPPTSRRQRVTSGLARLTGAVEAGPPPRVHGPGQPLLLSDEYARMWLVASHRILAHWPRLWDKRRRVQGLRRVSDDELLGRWPLHLVPTYPGDEELFASPSFAGLLPQSPQLVRTTLAEIAAVGGGV